MSEKTAAAPTRAYRNLVLTALIVVYTLNFLDRQILGILAKPIKAEFNLTDGQFGLMSGLAFAILYTTLSVPIAWLADRASRAWIITTAVGLWSAFTALCGFTGSFGQLFLARMGVGIGEAGGAAPAYSLIADYFPKDQRARALGAYSFGVPIGTAAGTLVGGLIAVKFGWRAAFITVGLIGLVVAPIFKMIVRDPRRGGYEVEPSVAAPQAPAAASFGEVFATVFPKPSFWLLAFGAACTSICGYGVALWLPSFFQRSLGLTLGQTAWYYSGIAFFGGVVGIWAGGFLGDLMGKRSKSAYTIVPAVAVLISPFLFILGMNSGAVLHSAAGSLLPLVVAFVIFLIPTGLNLAWLGPILTVVQHLSPANMRSTTSALFLLINNLLGIALGIYYFGFMSDLLKPHFGAESLRWSIYTGLGFYILAGVLFLIAAPRVKKDWVD